MAMHPAAHFLFGALLGGCVVAFGIELPRRRRGLPRSGLTSPEIVLVMLVMGTLAAVPQASRFFGDRKLDTGPVLNLFLFHDALNLASQRFRLGDGLLDSPMTVFSLALGVIIIFIVYLRSGASSGWNVLWRDVAYFAVIMLCLIAIRSVVTGSDYVYMPKTWVYMGNQPFIVVGSTVFTPIWRPVVGTARDKAIATRDAYYLVNATHWLGPQPESVTLFLIGNSNPYSWAYPLEYESLVSMLSVLRQTPGLASQREIARIISAGTLPRTDIPLAASIGFPAIALTFCGALLYPVLPMEH